MTGTPSWLSDEPVQDVKIDDAPTSGIVATQSATAIPTQSMDLSGGAEAAEADAELPRMILFMRLANLGVAGGMIACSVRVWRGILCSVPALPPPSVCRVYHRRHQ